MGDSFVGQNVWSKISQDEKKGIFAYCKQYIDFLNTVKTEREFLEYAIPVLEASGYQNIETVLESGAKLQPGDKVYQNVYNKSLLCAVVGSQKPENGFQLVGAHIDSPRLDFKQNPFYEENETVYAKTHYYGGIKKYQWLSIPLALHGVVITKSGETVTIALGDEADEPCFCIADLLPHLAQDQMKKTLGEAVPGESLNVIMSSMCSDDTEAKTPFKQYFLDLLKEKYNVEEEDFISAEIEVVPAFPAKEIGLDRSIIGAYGHDDRVCAYTALTAILVAGQVERTAVAYFSDKEEVGSMGNTGAQSKALENFMAYLCMLSSDNYSDYILRRCISNSYMLSADVTCGVDANFDVQDRKNAAYLNHGVAFEKYTGARGKSGASDANPEFIAKLRKVLDENQIYWQTGELGKVDLGGGGTIAQYMANMGLQVIDCGVPVWAMHSPFELVSKADVYYTYKAYLAFYKCFE